MSSVFDDFKSNAFSDFKKKPKDIVLEEGFADPNKPFIEPVDDIPATGIPEISGPQGYGQYPVKPKTEKLSHVASVGPMWDEPGDERTMHEILGYEPPENKLIKRFGHQLANAYMRIGQEIISSPLSPVGVPQKDIEKHLPQAYKEIRESGFKGSTAQAEILARTRAAQIEAAKRIPTYKVESPTNIPEKAIDVTAGLSAFITQIALTKKIMPSGTPDAVIWEIQNQASGGIPGEGMAMRSMLGQVGRIPTGSLSKKLAKVGLESGLFAGYTAATGGDAEEIIISGLIPIAFNSWSFIKQKRHINQYERNLRNQALQKHRQRINQGMKSSISERYLQDDFRVVDNAVAKAKQAIYQDDAFAPAKEKWESQRQKALKMVAKGGESAKRGNAMLDFIENRPGAPSRSVEMPLTRIAEAVDTTKQFGKLAMRPGKAIEALAGKIPTPKPTAKPPVTPVKPVKPQAKAEGEIEKPSEVEKQRPVLLPEQFETVEVPVDELVLSKEVPNFKEEADAVTGVVSGQELQGKYERLATAPIIVWERKDGTMEVITGRHRLDLARRTGEKTIPAQIVKENMGFTKGKALTIDAESNIREGQGSIEDYAHYFKNTEITEEQAKSRGLLSRSKGKNGFRIGRSAVDNVFTGFINGKISAAKAYAIANGAPNNEAAQNAALVKADSKSADELEQYAKILTRYKTEDRLKTSQGDLFGFDDSAIREAELVAREVQKEVNSIKDRILAVKGALKRPKTAKKMGLKFSDETSIRKEVARLEERLDSLSRTATTPSLFAEMRKRAGLRREVEPELVEEPKERPTDLMGRPVLKGGATGKQGEFLSKEDFRLAEPDIEGQKKLFDKSKEGKQKKGQKLTFGLDPGLDKFIAEDVKPTLQKAKQAGKYIKEIGLAAPRLFMRIIEPAKAAEKRAGKEAYTAAIRGIHKGTDVARAEFDQQRIESMDMGMDQLKKFFGEFSEKDNLNFLIANAGRPNSIEAELLIKDSLEKLPDALKQQKLVKAIREISEKNHKYLKKVAGNNIGWVQDYFYGIYEGNVDRFFKYWKTTKRFTKHKIHPSLADAINYGLKPRHKNYIDNLRAEYIGIARLDGMKWLRSELMRTGEGVYIDNMMEAPKDWDSVKDPVFADLLVKPELAGLINNLISTNKITQQPVLNAFRKVGNFLRILKFIGSIYHLRTEIKQSAADSGYLGFLHKKTATRGLTTLVKASKKQWLKLQKSPEYKRLLELGIGYRYSYAQQAQKQFRDFVKKINSGNYLGATLRAGKLPLRIPLKFTEWLFEQYIPMVKALKVMDAQAELENKTGRTATDWELINIIKETQNFYGEMNERLFGRSGTVTTAMRYIYLAPGFAEGNYRTILKSLLQWGQGEGWSAGRSRSNIPNSFLLTAIIATIGTLLLTGKPPKKPETLEDVRDLFKIDTGKKDSQGRKVMIDMMTYDKDYWNIYFNVLRGRPDTAVYESLRRLGGMKAPMFDIMLDFARMSTGQAIYDWKGDRVTEITDDWLEKLMKISIHEIKKTEPIPMSVFKQARKKETEKIISFVEAVMGVRPTLTEKDKREGEILRRCWSLKGQQEEMYQSLAKLDNPRKAVKWYNDKVKDVLESKLVPASMRNEWLPKLMIDLEKYLQNRAYTASRQPTTKEGTEQIERAVKILKNFGISANEAEQLLNDYYNRPKTKAPYSPIESDRILGRARKRKRLKERMQE